METVPRLLPNTPVDELLLLYTAENLACYLPVLSTAELFQAYI